MVYFIGGIAYTLIIGIITIAIANSYYITYNTFADFGPILWTLIMFLAPGPGIAWLGYNEDKRKEELAKNGVPCIAKLYKAVPDTGADYAHTQGYYLYFIVFLPGTNEIKVVNKIIATSRDYVKVGGYVRCKYYNDDIDIPNWLVYENPKSIPETTMIAINKYAKDYEIHEMNRVIQKTIQDDLYYKEKFGANK